MQVTIQWNLSKSSWTYCFESNNYLVGKLGTSKIQRVGTKNWSSSCSKACKKINTRIRTT